MKTPAKEVGFGIWNVKSMLTTDKRLPQYKSTTNIMATQKTRW
jgi:hypothetical protein